MGLLRITPPPSAVVLTKAGPEKAVVLTKVDPFPVISAHHKSIKTKSIHLLGKNKFIRPGHPVFHRFLQCGI